MQALLELAPVAAFFIAYAVGGIYVATAVLMIGMAALLAVDYLLHKRIPTMHALSAVLVFGLGAATLLLHDKHFIQLKPTALFWLFGLAFLASFWIGKQTLTEKLFTFALGRAPEESDAPAIRKIVRAARADGYRFSSLILGISTSTPFQLRRSP